MSQIRDHVRSPVALRPLGEWGPSQRWLLLAVSVAMCIALFLLDALTPKSFTFSFLTLSIFPILAVAWQLPLRYLVAVVAVVFVLDIWLGAIGELEWYRVAGQSATALTVAAIGRLAAVNSAGLQRSRERELAFLLDTARSLMPAEGVGAVAGELVKATAAFLPESSSVEVFRVDGDETRVVVGAPGARPDPDNALATIAIAAGAVDYLLVARGVGTLAPERKRVLDGISEVARLALTDATKLEAERARARTFETLHEFSIKAALADTPEEVAKLMVEQTVKLLGESQAVLAWQHAAGEPLRVLASTREPDRLLVDARAGAAATALREQRTLLLDGQEMAAEMDGILEPGQRSILVAPLLVKAESKGVLIIGSALRATDEDVLAISLLSSQTAPILGDAQLRHELEQSERRYRSLYHAFGCGVIIHDATGRVIESNWAAEDILGMSAAEIRKHPPFGPEWTLTGIEGRVVPPAMRPPANVVTFRRPLRKLVVKAKGPGGDRWLRIDSSPVEEGHELKMIITSFFPVPPPD